MADIVCNGITKAEVEKILQDYFKTNAKLVNAEGVFISKDLGVTSDVNKVKLQWDQTGGHLPTSVILKVPAAEIFANMMTSFSDRTNEQAAAMSAYLVPIFHATECKAYELLSRDRPLPIPRVYGSRLITITKPGLIVMEDLSDRAGMIDNIVPGLTYNQWRNVAECLADLHAWSLTTDVSWRDQLPDVTSLTEYFKGLVKTAPFTIKQTKEKYPEFFSDLDEERILQVLTVDNIMAKRTQYKGILPEVLLHGDAWINNFMFEKMPDGSIGDNVVAFIDWQICLRGCGVNDFSRLECMFCLDNELRRSKSKQILRIYYDRLKAKVGDKLTATFEQMEHLYREALALNGLYCYFQADFMLHNIAKVDQDKSGDRKRELLRRMKGCYEDSVKHYGW